MLGFGKIKFQVDWLSSGEGRVLRGSSVQLVFREELWDWKVISKPRCTRYLCSASSFSWSSCLSFTLLKKTQPALLKLVIQRTLPTGRPWLPSCPPEPPSWHILAPLRAVLVMLFGIFSPHRPVLSPLWLTINTHGSFPMDQGRESQGAGPQGAGPCGWGRGSGCLEEVLLRWDEAFEIPKSWAFCDGHQKCRSENGDV